LTDARFLSNNSVTCEANHVKYEQGWARGSFVEAEAEVEAERSRQRRGKAAMFLTEARQDRGRGKKLEAEARQSEINVVCVILISCTMHM